MTPQSAPVFQLNHGAIAEAMSGTPDADADGAAADAKLNKSSKEKTAKSVYKCFGICLVHSTPTEQSGKERKEYIAIGGQNGKEAAQFCFINIYIYALRIKYDGRRAFA